MATPLHDLKRLVTNRPAVSGRVVAVTGAMVHVATVKGVVEVTDTGLAIGDRVVVQNGVAVRTSKQKAVPIHFV